MNTLAAPNYRDGLGRTWPAKRLDTLLSDGDVLAQVMMGVSIGLRSDGTWSPAAVLAWARVRQRREDGATLLQLLVWRFFDTKGAHFLKRRGAR